MTAVENCVAWRSLKCLNLKQREKLLAAVCLTFQETVEGNSGRIAVACPQDFVDRGRRWGTNETEAQVILQSQWDNILSHHLMGITAAMESWLAQDPTLSSSSSCMKHAAEEEGGNDAHQNTDGGSNTGGDTPTRVDRSPRTATDDDQEA